MRSSRIIACALLCAALFTGCSKPKPPPPPDGTSGIQGVCLLPAEPPDPDGKVPELKPWAGVIIVALHTNNTSEDATFGLQHQTTADQEGKFKLALSPGDYVVGVNDPKVPNSLANAPVQIKVEPGRYTEMILDHDKLDMVQLQRR
jgi:hypothetical protein